MANESAVARLELDASGFDKKANASFREFSKQLTSVKDATDAAMRGAEALQKVFVKSLGGTIAIGAASAMGDAMRDVGNRIGSAGTAAEQAMAGIAGIAGSMQEASARAASLATAADATRKTLEELSNASPIQAGIFNMLGGNKVLKDLEESQRGLAGLELFTGMRQGNKNTQRLLDAGPGGLAAEEQRIRNEKELSDLRGSKAFQGAGPDLQKKILAEFEKKKILEAQPAKEKDDKELADFKKKAEQDNADYQKKLIEDAALDEIQRARQRERMLDEFRRGLEEDKVKAVQMAADRVSSRAAVPGQITQARASAASGILDIAGQAGSPYENFVNQARSDAGAAKRQKDIADLEQKAMEEAGKRGSGIDLLNQFGTQRSKRDIVKDYIKQQAGKEASGGKTLSDIYRVLNDALTKITSAPMVGVN